MANTPNYNFIISNGSDIVNPLTQIFPNFTSLDSILKGVEDKTIGTATELKTGTVHALTRADQDAPMFRFQATSNFETNDTFTVDGLQVSALDVAGRALANGAFIIGSMVLCELRDNLLTVYVSGSGDADTLDGHDSSYFATATDLATVDGKADANKVLIDALTSDLTQINTNLPASITPNTWMNVVNLTQHGITSNFDKIHALYNINRTTDYLMALSNEIIGIKITTTGILQMSFTHSEYSGLPISFLVFRR